jgi:ribosomal protein L37AE/L43A
MSDLAKVHNLVKQEGVIVFPRPCTLCDSRDNVTQNFGLWVCGVCVSNIQQANTDLFTVNEKKLPYIL